MDKWIAYSIACGLSFFEFGAGVYVALAPHGDLFAGGLLAFIGLTLFVVSLASALRETAPRFEFSTLGPLYEERPAAPQPSRLPRRCTSELRRAA